MTTNPGAVRTSNRRRALTRRWNSKEWKVARAAFLQGHPRCALHLKAGVRVPATHPHHPYIESYKAGYMDLSRCVPLCARCHTALHHGLQLCQECIKGGASPGKENYRRWDQPMCRHCFDRAHPEIVEAREAAAVQWKRRQREIRKSAKERAKKKQKKLAQTTEKRR